MSHSDNFIFGINPVLEKLNASAQEILEILVSDVYERPALRQIAKTAAQFGVHVVPVHPNVLDRLAGGQRHQGVVAKVAEYSYLSFADLLQQVSTGSAAHWVLILDGLTDPRNFGALLRTAEAVGVRHIIIPKDRSVDVTSIVVKASAGAAHHLSIAKVTNVRRAIAALKENGYWLAGLDGASRESIYERIYPDRLAIVLGNEGKGVRPLILRECDFLVSIPMLGKIASLNVSVAGAVFLYELLRQSRSVDKDLAKR